MQKVEKETIILWNEEEAFATIYSCSAGVWAKCERRGYELIDTQPTHDSKIMSKTYKCVKKSIAFKGLRKKRVLSDEQREKMRITFLERTKKGST